MLSVAKNRNFLVLHQGALGDFVLTFPSLLHLRNNCARMDGICQEKLGKLACHLHIFDTCFPLESAKFASLWAEPSDADMFIRQFFDSCDVILVFSFSQQLEHRIRRITKGSVLRIPPRPPVSQRIHVAQFIWEQLASHGLLPKEEFGFAKGKQESVSFSKKILIHPGSGSPRKNWPLDRFIQVYESLKSEGMEPEFIIGPAEEFLAKPLEGRPVHFMSELGDLAQILRKAGGYIGNDSGITHLAAFLGLPVTAIFGPADPLRWQPVGNVRILRASDLKCNPCFETEKENCADCACLSRISADMAVRMAGEMLRPG